MERIERLVIGELIISSASDNVTTEIAATTKKVRILLNTSAELYKTMNMHDSKIQFVLGFDRVSYFTCPKASTLGFEGVNLISFTLNILTVRSLDTVMGLKKREKPSRLTPVSGLPL